MSIWQRLYHLLYVEDEKVAGEILSPHRDRLVRIFGPHIVKQAEALCPEGDVVCIEREADKIVQGLRAPYTGYL